ncbi:zinc ion-binding protein, partial [Prunus dulcis]
IPEPLVIRLIAWSRGWVGGSLETSQAMRNFNKFIDDCEVVFVGCYWCPFYWCNGYHDNTIIYERLDRALANPDWMRLLPHPELQNLPIMRITQENLVLIQEQLAQNPYDPFLLDQDFKLNTELKILLEQEEVFYAQKPRASWLQLGDKNTKYFHTQALIRRKRNQILRVRDLNGLWVEGDILPEAFVQAFKLRFTAEQPPNHHLMMDFLRNPKTHVGLLSSQGGDRISNLVFADDCLIFAKSTAMAPRNINCLLDNFAKVSGQRINLHKSTVYFSTFLLGSNIKVSPVAWKDICLPQSLGGLRVRSAALFNKAALAKLGWICLTDSSNWWAQIMLKKYLKNEGFLVTAKKTSHSSTWKAILEARSVLHKECPLCKNHMETINHLFFECQFASEYWRCNNFDGIEWLASLPHTKVADGPNVLSKALLLCWQI